MSRVAKPPPWVAKNTTATGQVAWPSPIGMCLSSACPPNLPADCMLTAWQPLLPPPGWLHLSFGGLPPPPFLQPGAGKPTLHLSQPGAATPPVQWAPYPSPQANSWPSSGHLVTRTVHPNSGHRKQSRQQHRCLFRRQISSGGRLPHVHFFIRFFYIFLHQLLHGLTLLLHLLHILAWS